MPVLLSYPFKASEWIPLLCKFMLCIDGWNLCWRAAVCIVLTALCGEDLPPFMLLLSNRTFHESYLLQSQ